MSTKAVSSLGVLKLTALAAAIALAGCGGGDDDSGSVSSSRSSSATSSSSSSPAAGNNAPEIDAGAGVSVDAGESVQLSATASDSDGEIESVTWRQLSGPRTSLRAELEGYAISFRAPSTGRDVTAEMLFEVTAKDDDGASVSDTVTVTVNRMNLQPVVELGNLRTFASAQTVNLTATAYDLDGDIDSYLWEQVGGEPVALENISSDSASFDSSGLVSGARLEFRLTVTDNDGAQSSDQVQLVLTNSEAPIVDVVFPPDRSFTRETSLSAFGSTEIVSAGDLTKVVVDAGVTPVTATLDADGNWRADDVLLPEGVNEARMTITAYDSKGGVGYAESEIVLNENYGVGYGASWVQSKAVVLAPDAETAWVMADGGLDSDLKLLEIDLNTGRRSAAITDFSDAGQGVAEKEYGDFVYDKATDQFYLSATVYPDTAEGEQQTDESVGKIYQVDAASGMRTQLNITGLSDDRALTSPGELYLHTDGDLYLVDRFYGTVIKVDLDSNQAQVFFENDPNSADFQLPNQLTYDPQSDRFLVAAGMSGSVSLSAIDAVNPTQMQLISEGQEISFGPIPIGLGTGLAVDEDRNRAYMTTNLDAGVVQVNLSNGSRTLLAEQALGEKNNTHALAYDSDNKIIYVVKGDDYQQKLMAIDSASGDTVVVSKSSF